MNPNASTLRGANAVSVRLQWCVRWRRHSHQARARLLLVSLYKIDSVSCRIAEICEVGTVWIAQDRAIEAASCHKCPLHCRVDIID